MSNTRNFKCNSCGEKFKSNVMVQQYFGQVDENGYMLVGVGICPRCFDSSFKGIFEQNLENAEKYGSVNPLEVKQEMIKQGYKEI